MSDLTILLPGIMGSVLTRDGETLWNPGPGMLPRLLRHRAWVQSLMRRQAEDLTSPWIDGVIPGGLVRDLNIVPGLVSIEGYDEAHRAISVLPDIVEGDPLDPSRRMDGEPGRLRGYPTYFRFAYDWRRDLRASAVRLDDLVRQALPPLRAKDPAARVVLVGHSMGGLLARCWMEGTDPRTGDPFDGWRDTRLLVTLGTPHRGSINAVEGLVSGHRKLFVDFTEALRSFEGAHQLLPRYAALAVPDDDGGRRWVRPHEARGIPGLDPAAAKQAFDFHADVEEGQRANRADPAYPARALVPYVGFGHRTQNSAVWDGATLQVSTELPEGVPAVASGGDGTVPYASAVPIELSGELSAMRYVNESHGALQANAPLLDDVVRGLRRSTAFADVRGIDSGEPDARRHLLLECTSSFVHGEQLDVHGDPAGSCRVEPQGMDAGQVRLQVVPVDGGGGPITLLAEPGEDVALPDAPGTYRVTASADDGARGTVTTRTSYSVLPPGI